MRKADTRAYPLVQDAIDKGYLESGATYMVRGLPDHATANEARLSVGRALVNSNLAKAAWVVDADGVQCNPLKTPCKDEKAPHGVGFRLISKDSGRAYIVRQSGGNPANLKWNPFDRAKPKGFNDDGTPRTA